jgi:hypothetical protein
MGKNRMVTKKSWSFCELVIKLVIGILLNNINSISIKVTKVTNYYNKEYYRICYRVGGNMGIRFLSRLYSLEKTVTLVTWSPRIYRIIL